MIVETNADWIHHLMYNIEGLTTAEEILTSMIDAEYDFFRVVADLTDEFDGEKVRNPHIDVQEDMVKVLKQLAYYRREQQELLHDTIRHMIETKNIK